MSTNFRLEFKEPSTREEFIFWTLVHRLQRGRARRGEETATELQTKMSGHAVAYGERALLSRVAPLYFFLHLKMLRGKR